MRFIPRRRDYIELTEDHEDQNQTDIQSLPNQASSSTQSPSPCSSRRLMAICSGQAMKDITSQVDNCNNQQQKAKLEFALPKYGILWNSMSGAKKPTKNPSNLQRIGITPQYHRAKLDNEDRPIFILSEWKLAHEHTRANKIKLSRSTRGARPRGHVSKLLTIEENEEFDERLHEF